MREKGDLQMTNYKKAHKKHSAEQISTEHWLTIVATCRC